MRISDWSSDVCSPDLVQHGLVSSEAFGIGGLALGRFLQQQYVDADIAKDTQEIGEIGRRIFALIDAEVVNADGVIGKCRTMRFDRPARSEEHTSELQSLMRISSAVFCLQKKKEQ